MMPSFMSVVKDVGAIHELPILVECDARGIRESSLPVFRLRWKNSRNLHDAILCLNDLYRIAGDLQAGAGFRDVFEVFEYQAIQRFCAVQRQVQAPLAIQLARAAAAL